MYDLNGMVAEQLIEMGYGYGDFTILEDRGFIAKLREAINYFVATGKTYELAFHVAFGLMSYSLIHYGIDRLRVPKRITAIAGVSAIELISAGAEIVVDPGFYALPDGVVAASSAVLA